MLRFRIECETHRTNAKPAALRLEVDDYDHHDNPLPEGYYQVDESLLYCRGAVGDHKFVYHIVADPAVRT